MKTLIRPARVEDAGEIANVRVTTWRSTYRGLISQDYLDKMDIAAETRNYQNGLAHMPPERIIFVAEVQPEGGPQPDRGKVVGYSNAGPARDLDSEFPAELYALYILPEYQGRGIGRSLVREAAGWLTGKGYQTMIIYVLRENEPARKFYEAIGGRMVRELTRDVLGLTLSEVGYGYTLTEMIKHRS